MSDKNKMLEEMLQNKEKSNHEHVKKMEQRIEERVSKIISQKHEEMKVEKQMILDKYKMYEKKI
jgi:hypothetical protein